LENEIQLNSIITEEILNQHTISNGLHWHILRLDQIHPIISGNKYFKLKYYLRQAIEQGYGGILSFGGPYSNHIVASAYAAKSLSLSSIGIIRGQRPIRLSHTLANAQTYGMKLDFISRQEYAAKDDDSWMTGLKKKYPGIYVIPEGGYGKPGAKGAGEILQLLNPDRYSHICCACGTGTMLAGLINASEPEKCCIGISVLKGNNALNDQVTQLLIPGSVKKPFKIFHDFHFGGYAKQSKELLNFMNCFYRQYAISTDFIYTAKLMYAIEQLIQRNFFPPNSRILTIHSGGSQGNESLSPGVLVF
jgi:1-aminocyclopropane-1-carboxylate deaminase